MNRLLTTLILGIAAIAAAQEHPYTVGQRAATAHDAGRYAEAADLYARVVEMLPRSGSARVLRAKSLALAGKTTEALDQLAEAVKLGMRFDPAEPGFAPLRSQERFRALESEMRARTAPILRSSTAFELDKRLIPENIAHDPKSGAFYVGSMYKAKIIRIAADGTVSDFIPARRDGLLSVLGMKIDPVRRELWAAAGNFGERPPMEVDDPASAGKGALFRFHLDSGKLIGTYWAPGGSAERPMSFNDIVLTPEGDVYATAGMQGIWRLRSGADAVEPFVAPPGSFFNGIAITPDGRTLFAASHFEGVMKIDVASKSHSLLATPPQVALGGIDGLYFHEDSLVAIQNGTDPNRVIRAWLNPEMTKVVRFQVLEQEHPSWDHPLTGTIVGDHLYYVARSQLRSFEGKRIWPDEKLKSTVILKLPLEITVAPATDLQAAKAELLEMHRLGHRAHLERNADWIAATHGEDFVSATAGKISRAGIEETRRFFKQYLEGATYPIYEDLEPPVVRISDDGSMGWIMSRTRVRRLKDGNERSFVYAGVMIYERREGRWVRVANASTFE